MKYLLTMLHDGRRDCLERALAAFEEHVTPRATAAYIHIDGQHAPPPLLYGGMQWEIEIDPEPVGFCHSQAAAWAVAARSDVDWVFHLEDDFVIQRPVDLRPIAAVLEANPQLTQMALYRNPVVHEIPHGGYLNQFRDSYTPRVSWLSVNGDARETRIFPWFETQRNYCTNPALYRPGMCREHPWPTEPLCEGLLGFQMRERDPSLTFGIWGDGSVWAEHVGVRVGFGY